MATLIGQTNKYEIYVGKETESFFPYQAGFLFSNNKRKLYIRRGF